MSEDGEPASSPCAMPDPPPPDPDPSDPASVARWRGGMRARLIALRRGLPMTHRREGASRIAELLDAEIGAPEGRTISFYWPFRAEPDLRAWAGAVIGRGGRVALPVVVEKAEPLVFRPWAPEAEMARGVWNIPVPASGPEVVPDVVIAPLVGFDPGRYRLGYGGGFFDRTLAAHPGAPLVLGAGFAAQALDTIWPQPHDIPMHRILTEEGPR